MNTLGKLVTITVVAAAVGSAAAIYVSHEHKKKKKYNDRKMCKNFNDVYLDNKELYDEGEALPSKNIDIDIAPHEEKSYVEKRKNAKNDVLLKEKKNKKEEMTEFVENSTKEIKKTAKKAEKALKKGIEEASNEFKSVDEKNKE